MADPINATVYRDSSGVLRDASGVSVDSGSGAGGGTPAATIAGALNQVLADDTGQSDLDLTSVGNSVTVSIKNGQSVFGCDVTGLTGSGATVVCEMNLGGQWRPSNMLVNGTGGAFTNSLTADATFRANASARWQVRLRVSVAGTGKATISYSLSNNSSLNQLVAPLPPGTNALGTIAVTSLPKISFDGAQPVSLPSGYTLPVTQSGSWAINQAGNWTVAATQSGNWAATVSGTVSLAAGTSVAVSNFPSSFSVSNFPATQPVSGTVSVGNFPASQAVTGTFWQATQPISAASLPLPSGAATLTGQNNIVTALSPQATAAKQDAIIAALGAPLTVNDYRYPNAAAAGAITPKVTTGVSAFIASNAPCNFFGAVVIARTDGAGAYVFMLNRTTIPTSGSTINMAEVMAMTGYAAGGGASLVPDQVPDRFTVGCVVVCSSSIDTYTPLTGTNLPKYIKARVL